MCGSVFVVMGELTPGKLLSIVLGVDGDRVARVLSPAWVTSFNARIEVCRFFLYLRGIERTMRNALIVGGEWSSKEYYT